MNLGILNCEKFHKFIFMILMLLLVSSFFGCSQNQPATEEVNEDQTPDYVIKVDDNYIDRSELMIYVYQVGKEFIEIGGENVWEFEDFSGGKSAVQVAKDAVIENVVRIKVLKKKSQELDIELNEDELVLVGQEATAFFDEVEASFIDTYDITFKDVQRVFQEFAIAGKVLTQTTQEFVPENETIIMNKMLENEEYARLKGVDTGLLLTELKVDHILLITREKNQSGEYVTLTEDEKASKLEQIKKIRKQALEGVDFTKLRDLYSEETFPNEQDSEGAYEFSMALLPEEFESALKGLKVGQVSDIVETELGYHLFKVESIVQPSDEEILNFESNFESYEKKVHDNALMTLKQEAFNRLYEEWKKQVDVSVNRDVWEAISFTEDF